MCPDLFTSRLKRRRADSTGSPSPTSIFTETPSSVVLGAVEGNSIKVRLRIITSSHKSSRIQMRGTVICMFIHGKINIL